MPPLFPTEADREAFNNRHHREHVHIGTLDGAQGPHFLGIDAGSTTIKATLVNDDREIVWSSYATNEGSPLTAAVNIVKQIQSQLPEDAWIARSCATGYGEGSSPPACTWTRAWWRPWRTIVARKWFHLASPPSSTSAART